MAKALAVSEGRAVQPSEDEMGSALDTAETVQRRALEEARARVQQALVALQPFEKHEGRVLPGIERAVKDERERLIMAQKNLAAIVGLHLEAGGEVEQLPAPGIHMRRDEQGLDERLRAEV